MIFLNYIGVLLTLLALILFLFVNTEIYHIPGKRQQPLLVNVESEDPRISDYGSISSKLNNQDDEVNEEDKGKFKNFQIYDRLNPRAKKLIGIICAICCGIAGGCSYVPILYIENNYDHASQDQNDYAFSYNTGIFFGSLSFFIGYCLFKKNKPIIYSESILPTFLSGYNNLDYIINRHLLIILKVTVLI